MLAGSLRPSPLRAELDESVLRMPLRADYCLLDGWLEALSGVEPSAELRIVVTDLRDIDTLNGMLARPSRRQGAGRKIGVIREPNAWRGTAGLVRDLAEGLPPEALVAVLEAGCLPVAPLREVLSAISADCGGVIVAGRDREPAGISVFRRAALDRVSRIGYSDMKEQFIPALHQQEFKIALVERDDPVLRIRDRRSYLQVIANCHDVTENASVNGERKVDASARLIGPCVIERGGSVDAGAIVHESVVMSGARIEAGAVVSRSVIGRGVVVEAGERVIERILSPVAVGARAPQLPAWQGESSQGNLATE